MTRKGKTRLRPVLVLQDREIAAALDKVDGYAPGSPELSLETVKAKLAEVTAKQDGSVQAEAAMLTAKDDAAMAEENFHDLMLRVKKAVLAQFGEDSNEAQELGLKKKSEYKRPRRMEVVAKKVA